MLAVFVSLVETDFALSTSYGFFVLFFNFVFDFLLEIFKVKGKVYL